jgi:hypothetical protein
MGICMFAMGNVIGTRAAKYSVNALQSWRQDRFVHTHQHAIVGLAGVRRFELFARNWTHRLQFIAGKNGGWSRGLNPMDFPIQNEKKRGRVPFHSLKISVFIENFDIIERFIGGYSPKEQRFFRYIVICGVFFWANINGTRPRFLSPFSISTRFITQVRLPSVELSIEFPHTAHHDEPIWNCSAKEI